MKLNGTKLTTPEVRLSYCNLFTAHIPNNAGPDARECRDTQLIIPKSAEFERLVKQACQNAVSAFQAKNPGVKLPSNLKNTVHDGDGEKPNGGEYGPECKGCYVMSVKSYNRPRLIKREGSRIADITDANELYSGCYGQAVISFFVYSGQSKGITAFIDGFLKTRDGEPLGGVSVASDSDFEFDELGIDGSGEDFDIFG